MLSWSFFFLLRIPQVDWCLYTEMYVKKISFPSYVHNLDFILFLLVIIPWQWETWLLHRQIAQNATEHHAIPFMWSQCLIINEMCTIINFLDIIHPSVTYLKTAFRRLESISFPRRKPIHLGLNDRASPLSMALQAFGLWPLFTFLIFYTVDRTLWTGDQAVGRPLPTHRTTQTENRQIKIKIK